jgi:hypothetical protein
MCVFAMLGVLLHAVAIVRHSAFVVAEAATSVTPAGSNLEADFGVICHVGFASDAAVDTVPGKAPSGTSNCPICSGLCSAIAVLTPALPLLAHAELGGNEVDRPVDQRVERQKRNRPPGRGPPTPA